MKEQIQYIGRDVHKAMTVVAVLDGDGKVLAGGTLQTEAETILQFLWGLNGTLRLTFEESTHSAWLYDLLSPPVAKLGVCDSRKNAAFFKSGNKSDQIDAHQRADLLRSNLLSPVYHGDQSLRALKELARSYLCLALDTTWRRTASKPCTGVEGLAATGHGFTRRATGATGSQSCANRARGVGPRCCIGNSMP